MKGTIAYAVIAGIVSCVTLAAFQADAGVSAPLWEKAIQISAGNHDQMPRTVQMITEEKDKHGKVKHTEKVLTTFSVGPDGKLLDETVTFKDGKQVENSKEDESEDDEQLDFWQEELQDNISVTVTDNRREIDGRRCVAHDFVQNSGKDEKMVGTAWLDEISGAPLEVTFEPSPKPTGVKRMEHTMHYYYDADGQWYPTEMVVNVTASMLFIKKIYHITLSFSEYFRYTEPQ